MVVMMMMPVGREWCDKKRKESVLLTRDGGHARGAL